MNKLLSLLFPLAILISGCNLEDIQNQQINLQEERIFTASFEQNETRTYVENGNLLRWNAGDQISLFDGNTLNRQYQFDGETGDNSGTFSIVSKPFGTGNDLNCHYAVYPYASDVKITESGVITATLPAEQNYAENSFGLSANTMVAVTKDIDDTFLKFKNVGGYLKLQLYGDDVTVKSIALKGNSNEKIAGKAIIIPTYSDEPKISMSDDATSSITLNCGEGVKIGSTAETSTTFWIVVPPTTFESGFTITVTDINGETFTKDTSNEIAIERNVIKPMKAFEVVTEEVIPNNQIWYTSSDGNVVNPTYEDTFGANIKSNIYENGKGIITFDSEVTSIGEYAFEYNRTLTSIVIPKSVTTIRDGAFFNCNSLLEITIPSGVTEIGSKILFKCYALISIAVDKGNAIYDSRDNCNAIIETETNTLIYGCCNSVIPNSVTKIDDCAFERNQNLTSIIIPSSVTTIGNEAFYGCSSLTNVEISNGLTTIGTNAFRECPITIIDIPNSVTHIGDFAFGNCNSLTNVVLSNNLQAIGQYAFMACSQLTTVTVKAVTPPSMSNNAFTSCNNNLEVYVPAGSLEAYKAANYWKNLNIMPDTK